jgi:DNA mismatch endonuclease (patch repair protein)
MPDKFSPEIRSKIMANIKGKNTKPEVIVFRYLRQRGIYFQKHYKRALGSPDIALPRQKKAIFIDGDFWHGYDLERRKGTLPTYWAQKIIRNVKRDRRYRKELTSQGWQVMRIWEHELGKRTLNETMLRIEDFLRKDKD